MRSFGSALATLCVAFLVAGLVWPHIAGRLLQILIATLAVSYIAARAYRSNLPQSLATDAYSPFDAHTLDRPTAHHPPAVRALAHDLRAVDHAESAHRFAIPPRVRRILTAEASRRLSEHHALNSRDPSDHPRIRSLLSEATWSLVRPGMEGKQGSRDGDPVPLAHLDRILEELKSL